MRHLLRQAYRSLTVKMPIPISRFALSFGLLAGAAFAVEIDDTKLLSQPAISATQMAFAYANDIWIANLDGSGVRRLTSHPGVESFPHNHP